MSKIKTSEQKRWEEVKAIKVKEKVVWKEGTAVKVIEEDGSISYRHPTNKNYFGGGNRNKPQKKRGNATKIAICRRTGKVVNTTDPRPMRVGEKARRDKRNVLINKNQ